MFVVTGPVTIRIALELVAAGEIAPVAVTEYDPA